MKNIITVSLLVLLLLVGCTGVARNTQSEPAGSQMVPEDFIMQGELKEISDNRLLIDLENQGLTWVSVQDDSDLNISIHSLVSIQIIGGIMESYPGQASGHSVVVVTPFIENSLYTYDEMVSLMASGDKYPLVVWNGPKDMVAYAERMPVDEGYEVYVASLYESSPWRLALVYGTLPDLNWFYDRLEVQTSDGAMEFGPDFVQAEPYVFGEPKATEPTAQPDEGSFYELSPEIYEDQDHKIQIQYVLVEGMKD